jgi:probable F420-dependent oxidoreductase
MEQIHRLSPQGAAPSAAPGQPRPFRFGVVAAQARSADEWADKARHVESLGYATLLVPDNVQYTLAPLPALAVAGAATHTLRLGTYVLANDFRNPVLLAKDAATLDLLSNGRFELGIGAGRPNAEADYRMLGVPFDAGALRVARLAESLTILKSLFAGERASTPGDHPGIADAQISPPPVQQPRPPILVAGSGRQMLRLAAREADIVALGLPPDASEPIAADMISRLREAAGDRFSHLELNLNLMAVGDHLPRFLSAQLGLTAEALAQKGSVAALRGTTEQLCEQLIQRRATLGFSYIVVSDELMEPFAPVVHRLAKR